MPPPDATTNSGLANLGLTQAPPALVQGAMTQPDTSWVAPTQKRLTDIQSREQQEMAGLEQQRTKTLEADKAAVAAAKPTPTQTPAQPAQPEFNALQAFGSSASVFGLLASAFTRQPLINALNSSAAAMKAIHDGSIDNYNRAYQAWKDETETLFKKHQEQHEAYTDAMEMMKTDYANGTSELMSAAAKYGDERTAVLAQAGLWEKLGDMQRARQQSMENMLRAYPELVKGNAQIQLLGEGQKVADMPEGPEKEKAKRDYMQRVAAAQIAGIVPQPPKMSVNDLRSQAIQAHMQEGDDYPTAAAKVQSDVSLQQALSSGMTGPAYESAVEDGGWQWLLTGQMPNVGMFGGNASQIKLDIMKAGDKIKQNLGLTMPQIIALRADQKAVAGAMVQLAKTQANVTAFEGTAEREADLVESLAGKGVAGKSPIFNRWIQAGRVGVEGDADVTSFDTAITSFKNEYARIMSAPGATGGVTSDAARAEADTLINNAQNADQLKKNIATMRKGMKNRLDSFEAERKSLREQLSNVVAPFQGAPEPSPKDAGAQQYDPSKIYTDAKGRTAKWVNGAWQTGKKIDGKWVPDQQ